MRKPIDGTFTITNPFGQPGYGVFGKHAGVDLRATIGTPVYAPAAGTITEHYVGTADILVLGIRIGNYDHRFLHLSKFVRTSGTVKEGELIAYSGNSGNVAAHLHWDVRKAGTAWNHSFNDYINPLSLLINTSGKGDEQMPITNADFVKNMYRYVAGREASQAEIDFHTKNSTPQGLLDGFIRGGDLLKLRSDKQIADLKVALANEQSKPPKEVIKTVTEIVEKPVEVVKTVEVDKPATWQTVINFIREQINKFLKR